MDFLDIIHDNVQKVNNFINISSLKPSDLKLHTKISNSDKSI
jgi:hypothetical protein